MKTASQILADRHITLRSTSDGNKKTLCPQCSATRKHRKDPCLSVTIDRTGVRFFCHNCNFSGGDYFDGPDRQTGVRPQKLERRSKPVNRYAGLNRNLSHHWRLS